MKELVLILLSLVALTSNAQDNHLWFAFKDSNTNYIGFKNINGEIMIEPNLLGLTTAKKFDKIMAVIEKEDDGSFNDYYLTKEGKKIGVDSLFIYDNFPDCESEGFIRFMDKKTELIGMFNQKGEVAIPAEYNALSKVENGLVVGLKNAKKDFGGTTYKESGCNHFTWKDGDEYLIDTKGKVLVDNFKYSEYLNFYSFRIETELSNDSIREVFKDKNGIFYSFINFRKEFLSKLKFLLTNCNKENLMSMSFDTIYFWEDNEGWVSEPKNVFINRNFELVKEKLLQIISPNIDYDIFITGLNPYIYDGDNFARYFNNCGGARESKYPVINIVINNRINGNLTQDHFDFLKTDKGYELISITIRDKKNF